MINFLLLLCTFLATSLTGEIQIINHLDEIKGYLSNDPSSTEWVIFDIDNTLTTCTHPALQIPVYRANRQRFMDEFAKYTKEQQHYLPALIVTEGQRKLIDSQTPVLISELQFSGVTVFGFTALNSGATPNGENFPSWRKNELESLNINFSQEPHSPLPKESIEFRQFPSFEGSYPLYQDGVLYSNVIPTKGDVFLAFLEKVEQKPKRIIFIDDSLKNVVSVEEATKKIGIEYVGLHYMEQQASDAPTITDEIWRSFWDTVPERIKQF